MFQAKWFRAVLVMAVLASLIVAPLVVSAAETNGITAPADGASVSGEIAVTAYAGGDDFNKWDLYLLPGGDDSAKTWLATGDTAGEISVPLDTTKYPDGDHALSLRVVHNDSNYTEYTSKVTFANAAAPAPVETPAATAAVTATVASTATAPVAVAAPVAAAPVNGFTNVADGAKVSGTVEVEGYADVPGFSKWQLDVLPGGSGDAAIFVALGETAGEFTYSLDTTAFPDGDHALRLRVVRADSNYDEYTTKVTVANAAAAPAETPAAAAVVTATTTTTATVAPTPAPAAPVAAVESGITAPKADAALSGTVTVTGNAAGALAKWELLLFPNGDISGGNKVWLAGGDTEGAVSYDLDTTKYPDGKHALVLRVVGADSNYMDYPVMVAFANAPAAPAQ